MFRVVIPKDVFSSNETLCVFPYNDCTCLHQYVIAANVFVGDIPLRTCTFTGDLTRGRSDRGSVGFKDLHGDQNMYISFDGHDI